MRDTSEVGAHFFRMDEHGEVNDSYGFCDGYSDGIGRFGIESINYRIQCVDQSFVVVVHEVIVQLDSVLCNTVEQPLLVESVGGEFEGGQ